MAASGHGREVTGDGGRGDGDGGGGGEDGGGWWGRCTVVVVATEAASVVKVAAARRRWRRKGRLWRRRMAVGGAPIPLAAPGRRMDADGSIVYRWNHTFRIQMETDKVEPPVYADTRIPYTGFLCVCVYAHTYAYPCPQRTISGLYRVIQGYLGFIQGLSRVI